MVGKYLFPFGSNSQFWRFKQLNVGISVISHFIYSDLLVLGSVRPNGSFRVDIYCEGRSDQMFHLEKQASVRVCQAKWFI